MKNNKKIKIVALFGPAGSGKDYLLNKILKQADCSLNGIISFTTRPRREGEISGVAYNFISKEEFYRKVDNGDMLEASCFNDWWYGTALSSLDKDRINIGVFNVEGIRCLLDNELIEVHPIAITTKPKTRLIRQLNREDNPDIKEIFRRYEADERDFSFVDFSYIAITNENDEGIIELTEIINSL